MADPEIPVGTPPEKGPPSNLHKELLKGDGPTAVEYAVMLALIVVVLIAAASLANPPLEPADPKVPPVA